MTFSLIWMPGALLKAGLKVAETDGWQDRGAGEMGTVRGVLCHHTAGSPNGNMPTLGTLVHGRPDLPGPLAQLGLGRDGTFYVIAAGRANHAGKGSWQGVENGNASFIGIEAENTGRANDQPWPDAQMDAYRRGVAALLEHAGLSAIACAGHKEYALPRGRKPDPSFDMNDFRASVAAVLGGTVQTPPPIAAIEPPSPGKQARNTLRRGASGPLVSVLQERLEIGADGKFGGKTEAAVREFQRKLRLLPDGIVGPVTWRLLDEHAPPRP